MKKRLRSGGTASLTSGQVVAIENRVQGLAQSVDAITLKGSSYRAAIGDVVLDATLERTIEGASTLTLDVHDRHGTLLAHPLLKETYDIELDGLGFTSVKVDRQDPTTLQLSFEDREVGLLRRKTGARKAARGKHTLPQFALMLVREVKPPLPFYCPELVHGKVIASAPAQRAAQPQQAATRAPGGLTTKSGITVKHAAASAAQISILNQGLDTARSMNANQRVMISLVMTGTQESDVSILHGQGGYGWLSQLKNGAWPASGDVPRDSRAYLQHAIENDRKNPHQSLAALCQSVQASLNGSLYAQWESEATHTVQVYMGAAGSATAATDTGSRSQTQQLKRNKTENTWDCLGRLTDDVGWRRFESAGITYVMAETDLLASAPRMHLSDSTPGVEAITFNEDDGKTVSEAQVVGHASMWAAPPGTIVVLDDSLGPGSGLYVVNSIKSQIKAKPVEVTIDLKRPQAPHASQSSGGATTGSRKLRTSPSAKASGGLGPHGENDGAQISGVGTYKGVQLANWVIGALEWAARKGASPQPTSGYRPGPDPHTASGTSEHQGTRYPHGAVDFGSYTSGLAAKMSVVHATSDYKWPLLAPIGFHDDGHCSGNGH